MTAKMVPFATRKIGYDPDQVDRYFQRVAAEYGNLQRSYTELYQKYDDLVKQSNSSANVIAKAMINAEAQATRIAAEAKAEASRIINEAHRDREAVKKAKALLSSEINSIVSRLQSIGV